MQVSQQISVWRGSVREERDALLNWFATQFKQLSDAVGFMETQGEWLLGKTLGLYFPMP